MFRIAELYQECEQSAGKMMKPPLFSLSCADDKERGRINIITKKTFRLELVVEYWHESNLLPGFSRRMP